jgi:hypothetical protein
VTVVSRSKEPDRTIARFWTKYVRGDLNHVPTVAGCPLSSLCGRRGMNRRADRWIPRMTIGCVAMRSRRVVAADFAGRRQHGEPDRHRRGGRADSDGVGHRRMAVVCVDWGRLARASSRKAIVLRGSRDPVGGTRPHCQARDPPVSRPSSRRAQPFDVRVYLRGAAIPVAATSARRRCSLTKRMAIEPSPTAVATRLAEPLRTSPAAKTPGRLASGK